MVLQGLVLHREDFKFLDVILKADAENRNQLGQPHVCTNHYMKLICSSVSSEDIFSQIVYQLAF